jgi:hypothetical protein
MAKPVRARIYYKIEEKMCERGNYLIKGSKIPGYRNYYYKSALWLTWKLPKSKENLLRSIKKWKWESPCINYDHSKMDLNKRFQDHFDDYTADNKKIKDYDKFQGQESTIVTQIVSKKGPNQIKVFLDNGKEIEIKTTSKLTVLKKLQKLI